MPDQHLEGAWQSLRTQAEQHAHSTGQSMTSESRALMEKVTQRFCALPAPTTDEELKLRFEQQLHVSGIVSSISHAEQMAATAKGAGPETFKLAQALSEEPLPTTLEGCEQGMKHRMKFSGKISLICAEHRMRSYRHG